MIQVRSLTKCFGQVVAVNDLSFVARRGEVTGFLGPNGAGKSTTLKALAGIVRPTSGQVTIDEVEYRQRTAALRDVGVLLDAGDVSGGRSARHHLLALARSNGLPASRVGEVLELVGLESVATRQVGAFSLGMRQRLGVAAALLGDPGTLVLDEPMNGLDPEGIIWIRELLGGLARQGKAVLFSSHLMSEVELVSNHVVIVGKGRVLADATMSDITREAGSRVIIRSPSSEAIARLLQNAGATCEKSGENGLVATGIAAAEAGEISASAGLVLHELREERRSLEDLFLELTRGEGAFAGARAAGEVISP